MNNEITFAYPWVLYLLIVIPLLTAWYILRRNKRNPEIRFSGIEFFKQRKSTFRLWFMHLIFALRMIVLGLIILALARPQSSNKLENQTIEGIDIVFSLDISGSMLAEDFKPNRLEAAKAVAMDFLSLRPNDRIGLVVFSGESFTLTPLTSDHVVVQQMLSSVQTGMVEDGTAIGDGLATAINRLRESQAISKVIILLTDGINNMGVIDPLTAAGIAAQYNIRLYTIGMGSKGLVPYPFQTPFGKQYQNVEIPVDEKLLQQMAQTTGGQYFWAENKTKLEEIYREIDQLEKTRIDVTEISRKTDEFLPLLLLAMLVLMIEVLGRLLILRTIP